MDFPDLNGRHGLHEHDGHQQRGGVYKLGHGLARYGLLRCSGHGTGPARLGYRLACLGIL